MDQRWLCFILIEVIICKNVYCESGTGDSAGACNASENPCYRKKTSGEKLIDYNAKGSFSSRNVDDCIKACDLEKTFVCEGFNYRHSNHSESHGICELTSIPYMSIFMSRDSRYDYYERDYNCLQEQKKISGNFAQQQSKVPQSTTTEKYSPRNTKDYSSRNDPSRSYDNMFHNERPPYRHYPESYGRPVDSFYPKNEPHQGVVTIPNHRKNSSEKRGVYGSVYSGSYGYGTNSLTYLPPKTPDQEKKKEDKYAGEIGTLYKTAFGYENTRVPLHKIDHHAGDHIDSHSERHDGFHHNDHNDGSHHNEHHDGFHHNEHHDGFHHNDHHDGFHHNEHHCFLRARAGFKIVRQTLRKSCLTLDLKSCEDNCKHEREFNCQTFAYRYHVDPSNPTDNCLMSNIHLHSMNFYTDLEPDRNYDIYTLEHDSHICSSITPADHRHITDDCFWRVKSGFAFPQDMVRISITVKNLGQCQYKCIHSHDFICRSFVFRYEDITDGSSNCFLSDQTLHDLDPSKMIDMDKAEMYERNSFERGCEPHPFVSHDSTRRTFGNPEESCYSGHHKPCKLLPPSVRFSTQSESELDCRRKCSSMRRKGTVHCMSYSYGDHDVQKDNCLMSDLGNRDLRPRYDYAHDDGHVLYSWQESDSKCSSFDAGHHHHTPPQIHHDPPSPSKPPYHKEDNPELHFVRPAENGDSHHVHYHYNADVNHLDGNSGTPNIINQAGYGTWPGSQAGSSSIFRRYTVNGYPCKGGSLCEKNPVAGFWSCEAEGSEPGSWDYCCEPSHHCGYSAGFNYPWCYVGVSKDQWRPCSEQYFPNGPNPNGASGCSYKRNRQKCEGRHWPVTYLHSESPPAA